MADQVAASSSPPLALPLRDGPVPRTEFPVIMGILNVTPDSFSDGGAWMDPDGAVDHALAIIADGARIIDVGPESTRPGSREVPADEQIRRAVPVIRRIRSQNAVVTISIDTRLAAVAEAAIDAGADVINDTSALRDDPRMAEVVARMHGPVVLMHRRGTPIDMQAGGGPHYDDVAAEVIAFLQERARFAEGLGIEPNRIWLDPGVGFGKRVVDNLILLQQLPRLVRLGWPVLVGASRKRFLGEVLRTVAPAADSKPTSRDTGSLATVAVAALAGTAMIRVHDVRPAVEVAAVARAIARAG